MAAPFRLNGKKLSVEPGQREKPNGQRNASRLASDIRPASAPLPEVPEKRGQARLAPHLLLGGVSAWQAQAAAKLHQRPR